MTKGRFRRSMAGMAAITLALTMGGAAAPLLAQNPAPAAAGPTDAQLMDDANSTGDVLTYGMGPRAQRFSPLTQINADNVALWYPPSPPRWVARSSAVRNRSRWSMTARSM